MCSSDLVAVAEYVTGKTFDPNWQPKVVNQCAPAKWPTTADFLKGPHWNTWGVNQQNTRFQPAAMAGLDKTGVPKLELQWAFAFPGETLAEAHPSVVDGRLFVGSQNGTVYALDAKSGCIIWTFTAKSGVRNAPLVGARAGGGTAVFFGDTGANMYGVDASTGEAEGAAVQADVTVAFHCAKLGLRVEHLLAHGPGKAAIAAIFQAGARLPGVGRAASVGLAVGAGARGSFSGGGSGAFLVGHAKEGNRRPHGCKPALPRLPACPPRARGLWVDEASPPRDFNRTHRGTY